MDTGPWVALVDCSENMHPCGIEKKPPEFHYNNTIVRLELFSFAVPSTAKEIIFISALFASQAKRAVKQYIKYVIELTN